MNTLDCCLIFAQRANRCLGVQTLEIQGFKWVDGMAVGLALGAV